MGKAERVKTARTCRNCKREMIVSSKELKTHFGVCVRASKLGIIIPGEVHRPDLTIKKGWDD